MREYWLRTAIITIAFLDLCVTGISSMSHPTLVHIAWASYFILLLGLVISHRKKNMPKAFLNFIILLMIGVPIAGLYVPIAWILRHFEFGAVKGNFYMFLSLIALIYLAVRHEKMTVPEAASKVAVYVGEIRVDKLRSSFGRYLLGEVIAFFIIFALGSYYLIK
jgi:hypothetical protein